MGHRQSRLFVLRGERLGLKTSGADPPLSSSRACLHTAFIAFSVWHVSRALSPLYSPDPDPDPATDHLQKLKAKAINTPAAPSPAALTRLTLGTVLTGTGTAAPHCPLLCQPKFVCGWQHPTLFLCPPGARTVPLWHKFSYLHDLSSTQVRLAIDPLAHCAAPSPPWPGLEAWASWLRALPSKHGAKRRQTTATH